MWIKQDRQALSLAIYMHLFRSEAGMDFALDGDSIELIEGVVNRDEAAVNKKDLAKFFDIYTDNSINYTKLIIPHMNNWEKTYEIVKAVIYCYIIERVDLEEQGIEAENLIGKYVKLTQDWVAGGNTGLVHAVLAKL